MIEAEHASRLGFSAHFPTEDRAAVRYARERLCGLGIRHLRVVVEPDEPAAWLDWMFANLAECCELLPSVHVGDYALLSQLLALETRFAAVELRGAVGDDENAGKCVEICRARGKLAVLGLDWTDSRSGFVSLCESKWFPDVSAISLDVRLDREASAFDKRALDKWRDDFRITHPDLEIWLINTGFSTHGHQYGKQAQVFVDLAAASGDRIYWRDLVDRGSGQEQFGIDDLAGQPKLLGRLLSGGLGEIKSVLALTKASFTPMFDRSRPILVTGGAGFIGANLVDRLAADGHDVVIYDALTRAGVERNLRWLKRRHPQRVNFILADVRDEAAMSDVAAGATAVFHLAGQVAVTTSMAQPLADFEVNARGTVALLEALRTRNPRAPLIFASTNKVYGDLADVELVQEGDRYLPCRADIRTHGIAETRPLCFHTPYGCSKGTADQYVLDYAHSFGMRTAVLRMSCIYGERQFGTEDQGWVAHFLLQAIAGARLTVYGDGRQVRDILHVGDAISAYLAAWQDIDAISGRAYNLGGGPANAISLLQLIAEIEVLLERRVDVEFSDWRPGDQRYFVADTAAIRRDLSLPTALGWRAGLARLAGHFGAIPASVHVKEPAL